MNNTLSFYYSPYIHFESFKNVLKNLRMHYTTEDVFIFMDSFRSDLVEYKEIADLYKCKFIIRDDFFFYTNSTDSIEVNTKKMIEVFNRFNYLCENTNSKWVLLLEDDVIVKRKIKYFPEADAGCAREYSRPGGGAIFKRDMFLECFGKTNIIDIINHIPDAHWAGDIIFEFLLKLNNKSWQQWNELAEPLLRDSLDHAIYHGYKDLHNKIK